MFIEIRVTVQAEFRKIVTREKKTEGLDLLMLPVQVRGQGKEF